MLQERICQTLEKRDDLDQRVLARIAEVNESTISRYLNGRDELNFESVLKMVKYLYGNQEREIMAEYALTQRTQNARFALEYCIMTRLNETSEQVLEILQTSTNPVDKEWAKMYNFIRLRKQKLIEHKDLLHRLDNFKPNSIHMQVLKRIVKGYVYFDLNDHHSLSVHIQGTEQLIEEIKSNFIKQCFQIRLGLIMDNVCLYRNDVEQARYYNSFVMNQEFFESVKGLAFLHLGHSYMFEDYDKAYNYLNTAQELFSKTNQATLLKTAAYNISFLQSYWKIKREFPFELKGYPEKSEYVYYLIQQGKRDQAKEVFDQLDVASIPDWNKGFYYFYEGLIYDDKNSFYHSIKWFREAGDFFHVQLPIQALQQLNENELVLQMLAK